MNRFRWKISAIREQVPPASCLLWWARDEELRLPPGLRVLAFLPCTLHFACGGAVGDGGDGGSGDDGAGGLPHGNGPDGGTYIDSPSGADAQPANPGDTCGSVSSIATTGPNCAVQASEQCADGTTYSIRCSCVTATCSCSESASNSGSSSGGLPFACPAGADCEEYGYAACGFPSTVDAGSGVAEAGSASSCPFAPGGCPAGSYSAWFGDGMGNGGGGCMALPAACQSNATCGCLADAGVSGGCPCTGTNGALALCCN